MWIIVNSHKNNIALKTLLTSANQNTDVNFIIIIGGYDKINIKISKNKKMIIIYTNHNSIDFTAMITLVELYFFETEQNIEIFDQIKLENNEPINDDISIYQTFINLNFENQNIFDNLQEIQLILKNITVFFYIHDTCKFGPMFFDKIINFNNNQCSYCFIDQSMNIGIYPMNLILEHKNKILLLKNSSYELSKIQEFKKLGCKFEDFIFKLSKTHQFFQHSLEIQGKTDIYGNGVIRLIEYYNVLDLYKYKANWELKDIFELRN